MDLETIFLDTVDTVHFEWWLTFVDVYRMLIRMYNMVLGAHKWGDRIQTFLVPIDIVYSNPSFVYS